jgi:hypothetical protein
VNYRIFILCISVLSYGFSLNIQKDTLFAMEYFNLTPNPGQPPRDTFLITNADTCKIDSVRIKNIYITTKMYQIEMLFYNATNQIAPRLFASWDSAGGVVTNLYNMSFTPNMTIRTNVELALCIACPTGAVQNAPNVGDTMKIKMHFFEKGSVDSVVIISILRSVSMNTLPGGKEPLLKQKKNGETTFFSPSGKRITAPYASGNEVLPPGIWLYKKHRTRGGVDYGRVIIKE